MGFYMYFWWYFDVQHVHIVRFRPHLLAPLGPPNFDIHRPHLPWIQVEIDLRQPTLGDQSRLSQLCGRTNQFNTTQLRLSESEVNSWVQSETRYVLAAEVKDKFHGWGDGRGPMTAGVTFSQVKPILAWNQYKKLGIAGACRSRKIHPGETLMLYLEAVWWFNSIVWLLNH